MESDSPLEGAAEYEHTVLSMDLEIIRVDIPPTSAGITAALRRAFEPVAMDPCERTFAELLHKLN